MVCLVMLISSVSPLWGQTRPPSTAVRIGNWDDRVRLVIETERRPPLHRFRADRSDTVSIPLERLDSTAVMASLADTLSLPHPLIRNYWLTGGDDMKRLVLQLHRPARTHVFFLRPMDGHANRIVLDLFPLKSSARSGTPGDEGEQALPASTSHVAPATTLPDPVHSEPTELWLDVQVNRHPETATVLVLEQAGALWLSQTDMQSWGMQLPAMQTRRWQDEKYINVSGSGIDAELDMQTMTLALTVPPQLMQRTRLGGNANAHPVTTPPHPGAFFNYDISVTENEGDRSRRQDGFFELGAFNGWGSGTSSFIARDHGEQSEVVRLETAWRKDDIAGMQTLVLGDTVNGSTDWSGAVRFGGLHWGTNFSTRPEYLTMPLLSLAGEAALPSTVDIYINDALRIRDAIPSGPFSVDQLPVVSGSGEARIIVRDILGREQVITRDFYGTPNLLRRGLQHWSLDAGAVRENYSVESDNYGAPMVAATWRRGILDTLTVDSHAQGTDELRMGGAGLQWLLSTYGTVRLAGAASNSPAGSGAFGKAGFLRQGRRFSLGLESQYTTAAFRRLGVTDTTPLPEFQHRIHAGFSLGWLGGSSAGYTRQEYHDGRTRAFTTLGFSRSLGRHAYLGLTAFHFHDSHDTAVQATITVPLGLARTSASIGASRDFTHDGSNTSSGVAQLQRNLPVGTGYGFRLRTGLGDDELDQGSISYQNNVGTWSLEGAQNSDGNAVRANARGGIAFLDGNLLPSRYIDQSFAVVDVAGFKDVRIYAENQESARTNKRGVALVPRLRAYERNRIAINQADLPLAAQVGELEQVISPWYRSGVLVKFDAASTQSAYFRLLHDGRPVPAGAVVSDDQGNLFPVGLDGNVFISNLDGVKQLTARWRGNTCAFALHIAPDNSVAYVEPGDVACMD